MICSGRHARATYRIASACAIVFFLVNHSHKIPQVSVVLDNLVGNPFSLFHSFWSSAQRHKVAFDNVFDILRVEPHRQWPGKVVVIDNVFDVGHDATRSVHSNCLGEGRGIGQGRNHGRESC